MAPHKTVTINGRAYDAVTGLPIESIKVNSSPAPGKKKPAAVPAPTPVEKPASKVTHEITDSKIVHNNLQRSQTLLRRGTKKPGVPNKPIIKRSSPGRHMDIARSTDVTRFAKHPVVASASKPASAVTSKPTVHPDKPARVHPMAQRAITQKAVVTPKKATTAKEVKDAEIAKALAVPTPKTKKQSKAKKKALRRVVIISSIVLILLAGLFAAWRFIPNISVSLAAAQAGIAATYPEYTPDGYSLSQPVTYSDGEVDLKFTSNSNDNYYAINQARSSWDSSAVLDNVVTPAAGANYVTTKERGLTIYTYDTKAAWVNSGILYQINSQAPLTGDQIRRIATSL